jgi:4-amino-4-deoxy-L-arabinose transferase-like glycosyltransferase
MNGSFFRASLTRSWPLPALLLIAAVWLYRTPYNASNLEVLPDSVEYALAPLQLLETGRYEIIVEGRGLPPRYPPWFPALVILPAYVLFGHEPGNAILTVTFLAVVGIGFAYAIAKRITSTLGGVLAALAVLTLSSYSHWATRVMTDVPCTAFMLGTCLVYLNLRTKPQSTLFYFGAGALVAVTTLFRPVFAAMLLPFLLAAIRQRKGVFSRGLLLLAPMVAAVAATLAYNSSTFGPPMRNGYNFWVAVPMDYSTMIFSLSYLRMNLEVIALSVLPILLLICIGSWLVARKRRPAALAASQQSLRDAATFFPSYDRPHTAFSPLVFFPGRPFSYSDARWRCCPGGRNASALDRPGERNRTPSAVASHVLAGDCRPNRHAFVSPPSPVRRKESAKLHAPECYRHLCH